MKLIKKEVAERLKMSPRSVQMYSDNGLIPYIIKQPGKGNNRWYDHKAMFILLLIKELQNHDVSLSIIKKITLSLDIHNLPLTLCHYNVDTYCVYFTEEKKIKYCDNVIISLPDSKQVIYIYPIGSIVTKVAYQLYKLLSED